MLLVESDFLKQRFGGCVVKLIICFYDVKASGMMQLNKKTTQTTWHEFVGIIIMFVSGFNLGIKFCK